MRICHFYWVGEEDTVSRTLGSTGVKEYESVRVQAIQPSHSCTLARGIDRFFPTA